MAFTIHRPTVRPIAGTAAGVHGDLATRRELDRARLGQVELDRAVRRFLACR